MSEGDGAFYVETMCDKIGIDCPNICSVRDIDAIDLGSRFGDLETDVYSECSAYLPIQSCVTAGYSEFSRYIVNSTLGLMIGALKSLSATMRDELGSHFSH
jgi:hypothetical protein